MTRTLLIVAVLAAPFVAAGGVAGARAAPERETLRELEQIAPGLMNATCPLPGVVTGGQPRAEDFARFAAAGYRRVVDFRDSSEARGFDEVKVLRDAGLEYIVIPVRPGRLDDQRFDQFRELMRDESKHPVLVHCHSGNRVGAMMIPYLVLDRGLGVKKAKKLAKAMGLRTGYYEQRAWEYVRKRRSGTRG
jgi:uncharacterized protein (TIGR01244 family)